jgi:hypothetical protein
MINDDQLATGTGAQVLSLLGTRDGESEGATSEAREEPGDESLEARSAAGKQAPKSVDQRGGGVVRGRWLVACSSGG